MNDTGLQRAACLAGVIITAGFVFFAGPPGHAVGTSSISFAHVAHAAEEQWLQEFNDVCSKTTDSMSLNRDELKLLIARCDRLKPVIEGLEETARKVYKKRLEMCKNLLVFVLESKKQP